MDDGTNGAELANFSAQPSLNWPPTDLFLCRFSDIANPGGIGLRIETALGTFAGIVVRVGDNFAGYVDSCPHMATPLSELGRRYLTPQGGYIFCSGHGAMFRRLDGFCVAGPCVGQHLTSWAIKVIDGQVLTA